MNATSAVLDREIHITTDEIIQAHEQQAHEHQARPARIRSWLLGAGAAVIVAAAAVAISLIAG